MPSHDLEKFIAGFERFQQQYYGEDNSRIEELAQGQHPTSLLIGCSDSRVDPGLLMGAEPGDVFVSRNIANMVPPCEICQGTHHGVSAAIQFAVEQLKVERIIVLGHARCGGIRALMRGVPTSDSPFDFVSAWVGIGAAAKRSTLSAFGHASFEVQCRVCEQSSILNSLNNLMTYPWVREAIDQGKLSIHGWYFDLDRGELLAYSKRTGAFLPMVSALERSPASPKNASGVET